MRFKIFKNGEHINTIVADEEFCKAYCEAHGYTYEEEILSEPEQPKEPTTTIEERIATLETDVNDLTAAVERGLAL